MGKTLRFLTKNTLPSTDALPLVKGSGVWFWDLNGKRYLDLSSQTLNLLLGQCHPQITERVIQQAKELTFASSRFSSEMYLKLAEKLVSIAPEGLTKVNLKLTDGSDANETAIKIAKKWTGKGTVVVPSLTHVGQTTQALHLTGYKAQGVLKGSLESVITSPPPYCFRCSLGQTSDMCDIECATEVEKIFSKNKDIAAVLIDPVMVNAGVLAFPKSREYLKRVSELCKWNRAILVLDEIQTFGWVKSFFASRFYGINPDIMTLGKGLSAGYPLAACLMKSELDVLEYNEADFTYGGHPLSCAAALACLEVLEVLQKGKHSQISTKAEFLKEKLISVQKEFPILADIRNLGLIFGLEIAKSDDSPDPIMASRIFQEMLEKGVFCRVYGNVIVLKPPIIISKEELKFGVGVLHSVLQTLRR